MKIYLMCNVTHILMWISQRSNIAAQCFWLSSDRVKGKVPEPTVIFEHTGPQPIPDSKQSACRWWHA